MWRVNDDKSAREIIAGVRLWIDTVGQALNCEPIIYTSSSFWNSNLDGTSQFAEFPLWVAHYTSKPQPNIPKGFTKYTIWQFSEKGVVSGVGGDVDLNRYNGTMDELRVMAGL
jgi:lysozyme